MDGNLAYMQDQPQAKQSMIGGARAQTRRQRLEYQRQQLKDGLATIEKAIEALDAHPELEAFIETMASAGV